VIFEIRHSAGDYKAMPKTSENKRKYLHPAWPSPQFRRHWAVVRPVHRVNVDLTQGMLRDLDERAARLNISRQAVIKTLLARALNEEREQRARQKNT